MNHPAFPEHLRKGERGSIRRHQRKVALKGAMDAAYAQAEAREANRSQVSGVYLVKGHVDLQLRLEHHHLVKRSRDRGLIADPNNIFICSAIEHRLIEDGKLIVEGRNALDYRCHWSEGATANERQMTRIKSRRWSQEDEA